MNVKVLNRFERTKFTAFFEIKREFGTYILLMYKF